MKNLFYVFGLVGIVVLNSCENDQVTETATVEKEAVTEEINAQKSRWAYNYKLATTMEELLKLMEDPNSNIVRDEADFRRFISAEPLLREVFSDEVLYKEFVRTMRFNKKGLQTLSYVSVQRIYPIRYKVIMSAIYGGFGVSDFLAANITNFWCSLPATCDPADGSICITANC